MRGGRRPRFFVRGDISNTLCESTLKFVQSHCQAGRLPIRLGRAIDRGHRCAPGGVRVPPPSHLGSFGAPLRIPYRRPGRVPVRPRPRAVRPGQRPGRAGDGAWRHAVYAGDTGGLCEPHQRAGRTGRHLNGAVPGRRDLRRRRPRRRAQRGGTAERPAPGRRCDAADVRAGPPSRPWPVPAQGSRRCGSRADRFRLPEVHRGGGRGVLRGACRGPRRHPAAAPWLARGAGAEFFEVLAEARGATGLRLYGMPVLESPEITYSESRASELLAVRALLIKHLDAVLAVRIGATDLCGLFGLRRSSDLTVYDLAVVREVIADILNVLGRDGRFVVTGPVWEYFARGERIFKPQLRLSPFQVRSDLPNATKVRRQLLRHDLDGLLREVVLDKANGILGKTVIHPTHIRPVHAMLVVTEEEHSDACATLGRSGGGVCSSEYANKMIESKPHARWAAGILRRAAVFGVLRADRTFVDLLDIEDVGA